jgi:hypothetical protein
MNGTTHTGIDDIVTGAGIASDLAARTPGSSSEAPPITIPDIDAGSIVEVRRRFDRAWARGFSVVDTDENGYSIRRESDGVVLPVRFPAADLRLARNVDEPRSLRSTHA